MNRLRTQHEGTYHISDGRIWIAKVNVRGEWIEGRGGNREEAITDLIERLADRLEGPQHA